MLAVTSKSSDTKVYVTKFVDFNQETIIEAEQGFLSYRQEKIILNDSFYDPMWLVTNEIRTLKWDFSFPETLFKAQKQAPYNRSLGSFQDFVDAIKIYFLYSLGHTSIEGLQQFLNLLDTVIQSTGYFNPSLSESLLKVNAASNHLLMLEELADFVPIYDTDQFQEACSIAYDEVTEKVRTQKHGQSRQQRPLAEFQSFFYFDKLLEQFWTFMASDEEKLFYYPMYLWWKTTNVLPLRPTEFLVTPFECIDPNDEGEYILTVRRSNLKGHTKQKSKGTVTHKVDSDYSLHPYTISHQIAEAVQDYKERVSRFGKTRFLFSKPAYYASFNMETAGIERRALSDTFTIRNLRNILKHFYKDILHDKFGLNLYYKPHHLLGEDKTVIEDDDSFLGPNEIVMINPGDTRHIAMVNLVLNDFNPILIKDFAGHEDVNQSYHYFSHIHQLVKCMAYYKFQQLKKDVSGSQPFNLNEPINLQSIARSIDTVNQPCKEVDHGRCYSKKFYIGDISDCIPVHGDCSICDHLTFGEDSYDDVINQRRKDLEKRLSEEGALLLNLLTTYNDTYDNYAEFQRVILRIQQASAEYMKLSEKSEVRM